VLPAKNPLDVIPATIKKTKGAHVSSNKFLKISGIALLILFSANSFAADEPKGPSPEVAAKNQKANEACFACHSEEGVKHPPQEGMDLKKLRGHIRDKETFQASQHGKLACTKCHNDGYDDFPHAEDAKDSTTSCPDCHQKKADLLQEQFDKSVHAKNLGDKFTCTTCHNPHQFQKAASLGDPKKIVKQDNRTCLGCHDSDERFAQFAPEKKNRPLIDEIHKWLPNTRKHWDAVRCVECHTPVVGANDPISHQIVGKKQAERKCVACHTADSALKVRLYRHLQKDEQQKFGFINSVVLTENYVIGATRNPWLDRAMVGLAALTFLGVAAHAALRVLMNFLRRRKNND
jgi:predicted CXXCH cytochrome family protein